VVLCAGLWSGALGDLADTRVPVQPCEHFYLLTKPMDGIEGHLPTLSDHDGHLYIRDDVGGLLVGCFEPGGKVIRLEDLPRDFAFGLLDEDWDHFEPMMRNALHRIPALESAEVRMLLNGPESFTPDGSFLLGPSPDVEGLYLGCGMNSVGIATGGGAGKALATWIADGASPVDLDEAHPARFHPLECAGNALLARAPEVLGQHYAIAYPGREPETARDLKHGPVHERQAAAGARFGQRFGWERPLYFDPEGSADGRLTFDRPGWFQAVERECRAAHGRVALFDQSSFGKIRVTGPDAEAFLQRVCANDMARPPGRTIYTSLLNDRGGIESDLTALRLAEAEYLLLPGTNRLCRDLAWLRRHRANDDIGITDQTDDYAILGLMGPDSRAVLSALTGADLGNAAFPYFAHRPMEIADCPVRASRLSYVGELGWELTISAGHADRVFRSIMAAGEPFGITLAGAYAQTALRIEKRFLAIGHDIGPDTTPLEAGIGFAVKLDSGIDFIGRDALLRQSDNGTGVRLVTLMLEDRNAVPLGHEPILHGGVHVGQVTSAAFGHRVGAAVALGYVSTRVAVNDRCVQVDIAGRLHSARVLLRPAYDPKGTRMRADA
jgi:4-methylaminobutanoate oxidase (formaldehyde-forming)